MHFEIYKEGAGLMVGIGGAQWRWRLRAENNKTVASGEGYANKQDCLHAIDLLKSTDASTQIKETTK